MVENPEPSNPLQKQVLHPEPTNPSQRPKDQCGYVPTGILKMGTCGTDLPLEQQYDALSPSEVEYAVPGPIVKQPVVQSVKSVKSVQSGKNPVEADYDTLERPEQNPEYDAPSQLFVSQLQEKKPNVTASEVGHNHRPERKHCSAASTSNHNKDEIYATLSSEEGNELIQSDQYSKLQWEKPDCHGEPRDETRLGTDPENKESGDPHSGEDLCDNNSNESPPTPAQEQTVQKDISTENEQQVAENKLLHGQLHHL